jgi:hypothetical protein
MSKSSEAVKRWRARTKDRMVKAMGSKCQCCGYNTSTNSLAFHHIDPSIKDLSFGGLRANPAQWSSVVAELRKCILVCNNCHGEIHAGVRRLPDTYQLFDESFAEYKIAFEKLVDKCSICNNDKYSNMKFCSHKCAATSRRKVNWDDVDLLKLMKDYTIGELEVKLGISNAAIYKRRDKILKGLYENRIPDQTR